MLKLKRLSKEDYKDMGDSDNVIWTYNDAIILLTIFEMEVAGKFGESDKFEVLSQEYLDTQHPVNEYDTAHLWSKRKWRRILLPIFLNEHVPFGEVPGLEDDDSHQLPFKKTRPMGVHSSPFSRVLLLTYLRQCVDRGKVSLDIEKLEAFLDGDATAPSRINQSEAGQALAKGKGKKPKAKLEQYVLNQFEEECSC